MKKETKDVWAGCAVIVAVVIGVALWFGSGDTPAAAEAAVTKATAPAGPTLPLGQHAMKETVFGCTTPAQFKDASSYWSNDERALLAGMFDAGKCELLKKGETVILVDVKFMDYVVVRRPGVATKLVTFQSAI